MKEIIDFINSHDGCEVVAVCGDRLEVTSLCSVGGKVLKVSEQIKSDRKSVRDWLGY